MCKNGRETVTGPGFSVPSPEQCHEKATRRSPPSAGGSATARFPVVERHTSVKFGVTDYRGMAVGKKTGF